MAKYWGMIGFAEVTEDAPGVFTEKIQERRYTGDILRNSLRIEKTEHLNDNINISNMISVIADSYAEERMGMMRYITWMGTKWNISSIEVRHPRLNITVGGVYNEEN